MATYWLRSSSPSSRSTCIWLYKVQIDRVQRTCNLQHWDTRRFYWTQLEFVRFGVKLFMVINTLFDRRTGHVRTVQHTPILASQLSTQQRQRWKMPRYLSRSRHWFCFAQFGLGVNNQRWVQKRGLIEGSTYKMTSWATLHLYKVAVMSGNSSSTDLNLDLVMEQRRNVKAASHKMWWKHLYCKEAADFAWLCHLFQDGLETRTSSTWSQASLFFQLAERKVSIMDNQSKRLEW